MTFPTGEQTQEHFAACMRAVGEGRSREAFGQLFDHFAPRLKRFFMRASLSAEQAEDLAQETMVQVWRRAGLYDPARASVSTWIFRIGRNRMIDDLRRSVRPDLSQDDPILQPAALPEPERIVLDAQMAGRLRAEMQALPPEQQNILRAAFYEGQSHSQISDHLGLPLGTVKSRLRLAFRRLRDVLEEL